MSGLNLRASERPFYVRKAPKLNSVGDGPGNHGADRCFFEVRRALFSFPVKLVSFDRAAIKLP